MVNNKSQHKGKSLYMLWGFKAQAELEGLSNEKCEAICFISLLL